ncbi:MAG: hypothetical protein R3C49_02580 [Planctomycetaceae bacterium]
MTIKTCLFDMGNVLVYFSHDRMCDQVAEVCGISPDHARDLLLGTGLQLQLESGRISEEDFHATLERELDRGISFADLKYAAADIFWLNESIVPLLRTVRSGNSSGSPVKSQPDSPEVHSAVI